METEHKASQYLNEEILRLFHLRREHEDKVTPNSTYISKAIETSSLAKELLDLYILAISNKPFSLLINNRTAIYHNPLPVPSITITEYDTLLIDKELLNSISAPLEVKVVENISPYKSLATLFHFLAYEVTLEEVIY